MCSVSVPDASLVKSVNWKLLSVEPVILPVMAVRLPEVP